ncbi:hypothetical protein T09_10753 [Trichinella sp. T9]|nr:hypothetical protein T09_10753 [Trichinella sp. T9]
MDESTLPRNEALPNNLLTVSTDGDPAMVGCHRKFITQLKNSATDVLAVHCAIRRQFCEQNDEKFNRLLIYTEVRWLLKVYPDSSRKTCKYKHSSHRESVGSISTPPLSRLDLHSYQAFAGILNVMDQKVLLSAYQLVVYQMVCIQH